MEKSGGFDASWRNEIAETAVTAGVRNLIVPLGLVSRAFNEDASRSRSYTPQTEAPSALGSDPERSGGSRISQTWLEREAICDEIGEFIKRSLDGDHRGASGRDRLRLPSRIWLVFRDYEGLCYKPGRVCRSWQICKNLVKRGDGIGDSVFVGFPSEREARRVAGRSGVGWPFLGR